MIEIIRNLWKSDGLKKLGALNQAPIFALIVKGAKALLHSVGSEYPVVLVGILILNM